MLILDLRILIPPGKEAALRREAHRLVGPTRALPGCLDCHCLTDIENDSALRLISRWDSLEHFERHIRSDDFRLILGIMDLSEAPPEFHIHTIARSQGIDELSRIRQ